MQPKSGGYDCGMNNDTPCTPEQRQAVTRAAQERIQFLRWIAEKLLVTDDIAIRREASRALLQLLGDV